MHCHLFPAMRCLVRPGRRVLSSFMPTEQQIAATLARVPTMDQQSLLTLRVNAERMGAPAAPVIQAIDARLAEFKADGGMAVHRLEFARGMLRLVQEKGSRQWLPARDIFEQTLLRMADNPFVIWRIGNTARDIPVTKALDDVLPEFRDVERMKDHQSKRVFFRVRA